MSHPWLHIERGAAPLIVSMPHTGVEIPADIAGRLVSPWLARKDADWHVERLYAFARELGATTIRTAISRSVIDVNRDPSGASLYPGAATTELCPTTTFDGEPLYAGGAPDEAEIARRRALYFDPYHATLAGELDRLRAMHGTVVLYEAHAIRSRIPRLFEGALPHFNIGSNSGASCALALAEAVEAACAASPFSHVVNGRFKGGYTTRHYGAPGRGVNAIQMELACRGYMAEPEAPTEANWPTRWDSVVAATMIGVLRGVLGACMDFAKTQISPPPLGDGDHGAVEGAGGAAPTAPSAASASFPAFGRTSPRGGRESGTP